MDRLQIKRGMWSKLIMDTSCMACSAPEPDLSNIVSPAVTTARAIKEQSHALLRARRKEHGFLMTA